MPGVQNGPNRSQPHMRWDLDEFEEAANAAVAALSGYVGASQRGEGPALRRRPLDEVIDDLDLRRWMSDGGMEPKTFAEFLGAYLENSTRLHHPGYIAHQAAAPDFPAALADLVHGAINNPMAIYEMGPAGTAIELVIIEWMQTKLGWDAAAGAGVLTHGGSLANLTALLAARGRVAPEAWVHGSPRDLVVLAPRSAHYSLMRAAAILGLGEGAVAPVETDALERVVPERLPDALSRVQRAGRRPMALVANACATGTGLYDNLEAIAAFCNEQGIWLHVDAAHGASALLSPRHQHLLSGIENGDSVVWDTHKMLRTSSLCSGVLFRESVDLANAFHQEASYLFYGEQGDGVDLIERAVECSKAPLGLKLFLNIAWRGERGLGEHVAQQYDVTRRFYEIIRERPGFECPYEPQSNILCFRFGGDDDRQIDIRERLLREGNFHISSTEVDGTRYLRLSVQSPGTDEETLSRLLDAIERIDHEVARLRRTSPWHISR